MTIKLSDRLVLLLRTFGAEDVDELLRLVAAVHAEYEAQLRRRARAPRPPAPRRAGRDSAQDRSRARGGRDGGS